jgi:hypothetical protein
MRKTRFRKFSGGIYHTILKKAKSTFVPGFSILPNEQYFDNFPSVPDCQMLRSDRRHRVTFYKILADDSGAAWGAGVILLYAWAPLLLN